MRSRRRALTSAQQHQAASGLKRQLHRSGLALRARHIAAYLAQDGEISPAHCLQSLPGHRLYLPRLHPLRPNRLEFHAWRSNTRLEANRFGIPEPRRSRQRPWWSLSLILLPLVAFDPQGQRLGMGGGFYDRSLNRYPGRRPLLFGLAHDCQQVALLPVASWDIALDGILTGSRILFLNQREDRRWTRTS